MSIVLEAKTPTIQSADGTLIWAATAGRSAKEAPAVVFVPGFSMSSLIFRKQFEDKSFLAKYCLITYEPRGQGRSGQPLNKEAYSSARNAEDFRAVCEAFGARKVVHVGWSYGGLIPADVFAHLGPDWISGVILLSGIPWRSMLPDVAHPYGSAALAPLIQEDATSIATGFEMVFDSCFHPSVATSISYTEKTALIGAIAQQHPIARTLLLTAREQTETRLMEYASELPILLIIGEYDRQLNWVKLDELLKRAFKRYELLLVKDAAHASFWEKPDETNPAIGSFIDKM
ncbi:hypothetical protein N7504_007188 [Penicillium tannophilum]|nr:hypothetical protein N7504_007188 [Penicillium tannophilum]